MAAISGIYSKRVHSRVPNLTFLKPDFEILAFLTPLAFLGNKKSQTKSGFFHSERLGSGETFSELHIHYKSLLKTDITMQGAHNIEKILLLP